MGDSSQIRRESGGSRDLVGETIGNEPSRERGRILRQRLRLFQGVLAVVILYYLSRAVYFQAPVTIWAHSVALVLLLCSVAVLWRSKRIEMSAWFFMGIANTEIAWVSLGDGMSGSLTLWLVAVVPLIAAQLLDLRATILAAVVAYLDILLIGSVEYFYPIPQEIPNTENDYLVFLLLSYFILTLVAYLSTEDSSRELNSIAKRREELRLAHQAAEHSNRAKSRFLAKMSHEIRTPMNGLLGITQHLAQRNLPAEQHRAVLTVHRCGENLLALLNDVLDISKVESGELELSNGRFDLSCTLQDLRGLFLAQAELTGIELEVRCDQSPWWCIGDEKRLRQVVSNLVGNAIKFSDGGTVSIVLDTSEYRQAPVDGQKARCLIRVQDEGIGMNPQQQAQVFDEFVQGDGNNKRGGTGLGLSISRTLVRNMGGELQLQSQWGVGSTFTVLLPLERAACGGPSGPDLFQATSMLGAMRARILVVDDNAVNLRVATLALQKLNCVVTSAKNGLEAVQTAQEADFDLILMDMRMPIMDGLLATEEIQSSGCRNAKTPIVALTANAFEEDRAECLAVGMVDHLAKPFSRQKLEHTLFRWLKPPELHEEDEPDEDLRCA